MKIYGISDLHLPGGEDKPMDIFGPEWQDHPRRIKLEWRNSVGEHDIVLSPGDLSWAMHLHDARADLEYLGSLPGTTILVKGNHDLWWKSISQLRQILSPNVYALQNDFHPLPGNLAICGTRGWKCPGAGDFTEADERIYFREIARLELSLEAAIKAQYKPYIVMLHYPPTDDEHQPSGFTEAMEEAGVKYCVYGHLHGYAQKQALEGERYGIHYHLVAADAIGFRPKLITTLSK